jgi:hypothetical protein
MDGRRRRVRESLLHPQSGAPLVWYQEAIYHPESQRFDVVDILECLDEQGRVSDAWRWRHVLKVVFRHELEHLLARVGLRVIAKFGDFNRTPLRDDSSLMLVVADRSG